MSDPGQDATSLQLIHQTSALERIQPLYVHFHSAKRFVFLESSELNGILIQLM